MEQRFVPPLMPLHLSHYCQRTVRFLNAQCFHWETIQTPMSFCLPVPFVTHLTDILDVFVLQREASPAALVQVECLHWNLPLNLFLSFVFQFEFFLIENE